MSTGRYIAPTPAFLWLQSLSEVHAELRVRRHYLRELRQQVKRHRGYRHDAFWQMKSRADRIEEEIARLEQRAAALRKRSIKR
jgi:hypothetical protein